MGSRYEYSYTDANAANVAFGLYGVGDDVVNAIGFALQNLPTISNVAVKRYTEQTQDVTGQLADPAVFSGALQSAPAGNAARPKAK